MQQPPLVAGAQSHDRVAIPTLWVAFALSLGLHALLLWGWPPKPPTLPFDDSRQGKQSGSLALRLAPPKSAAPAAPPAPAVRARPSPAHRLPQSRAVQKPPPAPQVLALERPAAAAAPPPAQDFAALVESRRRAHELAAPPASAPPGESEQARHNRIVAENLGLSRTPGFGAERNPGGGIFQIARVGYDEAEFFFFGWNKEIRRNSRQMIEVRRGSNPSMEIAVVRRMIMVVREHVDGDFLWESRRLGRDVTLSARVADNAGLEDFLLREFFPDFRPGR